MLDLKQKVTPSVFFTVFACPFALAREIHALSSFTDNNVGFYIMLSVSISVVILFFGL